VKVRTRSATTGTWSAWRPVTVTNDDVPDGTGRERSRQGNRAWSAYAKPATSTAWSLTATDAAGNTATSSVTRTTSLRSDSSSSRTGTWKTTKNSQYLGGTGIYSSAKGATASWTVTARSVALIDKRATTSGKYYVYVDGAYVATVDTKASSSLYRQIQWTRTWSTSSRHTIKIKVAGTSGRPTIALDGLAYIG
jgi:hypothetical protein